MKNLLPLLLIIFTISVFIGCQSDSQTAKKPKTEQRKKNNKKKKANQKIQSPSLYHQSKNSKNQINKRGLLFSI